MGRWIKLSQLFPTIVVFFQLIDNILFKLLRTDEHGAFVPGRRWGLQGKKGNIPPQNNIAKGRTVGHHGEGEDVLD